MRSCASGNLEIPRCAIAHLRFDAYASPRNDELSAIAVETIVAIVETPAVVPIPRTRNPEYAIDRTHRSADAGADRAANHAAYRTGSPIAFIRALLRTAHDALGVPDMGDHQQCERERRARQMERPRRAGRQRRRRDLRLVHLVLSIAVAGREW